MSFVQYRCQQRPHKVPRRSAVRKSADLGVVPSFSAQCIGVSSGITCQVNFPRPKVHSNDLRPAKSVQQVNAMPLVNLKKKKKKKKKKPVKVTFLPHHATRSHRPKIAVFKSCSDSPNTGRIRSAPMPAATLQSFKTIGRPEVRQLGRGP